MDSLRTTIRTIATPALSLIVPLDIALSVPMSQDKELSITLHFRTTDRLKIGAGGMGEVYLAHDTKLDRKKYLKILPADICH